MSATRVVALLRGINLGSHNKLAMPVLRELAAGVGASDVATHVQSGNLVATTVLAPNTFGEALAAAIATAAGIGVPVVTRTADEWRSIEAANPYPAQAAADPTKVHLMAFARRLDDRVHELDVGPFAPDELTIVAPGTELYLHVPDGLGRSKLAARLASGAPTRDGTMRNWRTVEAISALL